MKKTLARHSPHLIPEWSLKNLTSPDQHSYSSNKKAWWDCTKCKRDWFARIGPRAMRGVGCPYCAGKRVLPENSLLSKRPDLAEEMSPKNGFGPDQITAGSGKKIWWDCKKCKSEWKASPNSRTSMGSGCPKCANWKPPSTLTFADVCPHLVPEWADINLLRPEDYAPNSHQKVWWKCKESHLWMATISNRKYGHGCPACFGRIATPQNNLALLYPHLLLEIRGDADVLKRLTPFSNKVLEWGCHKCSHVWRTPAYVRARGSGCPNCAWTHTKLEKSFEALMGVEKWGKNPPDTDLKYLPDFRLADKVYVDTDGLYWHSEAKPDPLPRTYHRDKAQAFRKAGLRLLQFYEDEIRDKPLIVKSICDHVLCKTACGVGARECEIVDVSPRDGDAFMADNHLIGAPGMSRYLALQHEGRLIAVVAYKVGKDRVDLTRFCLAKDVSVPGAATRLVREIQRLHPGLPIYTQVDHRYATVDNWLKWGWRVVRSYVNYQYTDGVSRKDKRCFRVPAGTNEEQAAKEKGWFRIYDAGKTTLVLG